MKIKELYISSLKNVKAEEIADLILYRPFGFLISYALRNTPVTPTFITVMSMTFGIASGFAFYFISYPMGALLLLIANTLDCADGQLARMTKKSSNLGRVLDGFADYSSLTFAFWGFGFALIRDTGEPLFFIVGWIAAISNIVQAITFDNYRSFYMKRTTIEEINTQLEVLNDLAFSTRNPFIMFLCSVYWGYLKNEKKHILENKPLKVSDFLIRALSFTGTSTHVTLICIFSLFARMDLYFYTAIGMNAYMGILLLLRRITMKKLTA